jgi:uncharacterized protein (DUF1501 family)
MVIKRRDFLRTGALAAGSLMVPRFLTAFQQPNRVPPGNRVLLVIQFSGGNDCLNTVIPTRNDIYYRERPKLGITKDKSLLLTDEASLHPALQSFKSLYDEGALGIMNSVGYPNPDRSHFRSMDIWHSASSSTEYVYTGWLGRYLDAECGGCDQPTAALELDDMLGMALKGEKSKGLAFKDPARLYNTSHEKFFSDLAKGRIDQPGEQPVDYLYKTMTETLSSADYIFKQSKLHPTTQTYPNTELGRSLKTIASLIFSDINTRVYYVSLGSFDTHVGQENRQQQLFAELNNAMDAFVKDLKANNRFNDVLTMSFSEFGRRVAQNASGGTDHGTAGNMFFVSGGLRQKGLLNELPNLADLQDGDLKHRVDFKNVYATVLNKWLGADDKKILNGNYSHLGFI